MKNNPGAATLRYRRKNLKIYINQVMGDGGIYRYRSIPVVPDLERSTVSLKSVAGVAKSKIPPQDIAVFWDDGRTETNETTNEHTKR